MNNHMQRFFISVMLVGTFCVSFDVVAGLQWHKNMAIAARSTHVVPSNQELCTLYAAITPSMNGVVLTSTIEQLMQKIALINNEQERKHVLLSLIEPVSLHIRGQLVASLQNIDRQIKVLTYNRDHSIKRYFFQIPTQWKRNTPEIIQAQLADLHTRRNQALTVLSGMTDMIVTFNGAIDSNGLSGWINTFLATTAPLMRSVYNATPLFSVALQNMNLAIMGMNRFSNEISVLCFNARMMNHMHTGYRYFKPAVIGVLAAAGSYLGYQWANRKIDAYDDVVNNADTGVGAQINQQVLHAQNRVNNMQERANARINQIGIDMQARMTQAQQDVLARLNTVQNQLGQNFAHRYGGLDRDQIVHDIKEFARTMKNIGVIHCDNEHIVNQAEYNTLKFLELELLPALLRFAQNNSARVAERNQMPTAPNAPQIHNDDEDPESIFGVPQPLMNAYAMYQEIRRNLDGQGRGPLRGVFAGAHNIAQEGREFVMNNRIINTFNVVTYLPELLYLIVSMHKLEIINTVHEQTQVVHDQAAGVVNDLVPPVRATVNDVVNQAREGLHDIHGVARDAFQHAGAQATQTVVHGLNGALNGARFGSKVAFGGIAASALCYSLYKMATVKSTQHKETIAEQLASIQDMLMHVDNAAQLDVVMRGELIYRAALIDDATHSYGNDRIGNCLSVLYDSSKSPFNKMKAAELVGQLVKPA